MIFYALALVIKIKFIQHYIYLKKRGLLLERFWFWWPFFSMLSVQYGYSFVVVTVRLKEHDRKSIINGHTYGFTIALKVLSYLRRYLHKCLFMLISLSPGTICLLLALTSLII